MIRRANNQYTANAMRRAFRILAALVTLIGFGWSDAHAQVPLTGAGRGAPGGGGPTVTVNAVDAGATGVYQANGALMNYSNITVAAGATELLCTIIRAGIADNADAGVALTWDNLGTPQSMTQVVAKTINQSGHLNNWTTQWWHVLSPHVGNLQLHATWTNAEADNFLACISFNSSASIPNTNTGAAVTSITVTSDTGHITVGAFEGTAAFGTILGTTIFNDSTHGSTVNAAADYISGSNPTSTVGTAAANLLAIAGADVSP